VAHQSERGRGNVLGTALKSSPAGESVHVHVTTTQPEALVRIVAHGPGIAAAEQERIFEPFHRSGRTDAAGAGLGLAIARGFTEANGGRLWAESLEGQGAAFVLALPIVRAEGTV